MDGPGGGVVPGTVGIGLGFGVTLGVVDVVGVAAWAGVGTVDIAPLFNFNSSSYLFVNFVYILTGISPSNIFFSSNSNFFLVSISSSIAAMVGVEPFVAATVGLAGGNWGSCLPGAAAPPAYVATAGDGAPPAVPVPVLPPTVGNDGRSGEVVPPYGDGRNTSVS